MRPPLHYLLPLLGCLAIASLLVAQLQVNTQVQLRVDNSLFGAGSAPPIRYSRPTSPMMPSEMRNAYWKSGALPSEWRMNAARVGPLAPGGSAAYIPAKPAWTQVHVNAAKFSPPPQSAAAYGLGTIRHVALPPSANQVVIKPFDTTIRTTIAAPTGANLFSPSVPLTGWTTTLPASLGAPASVYTPPRLSGSIHYP